MKYKQAYLKNKTGKSRITLNFHNPYMSFLEGVLCRGDRRISDCLYYAFKNGAKFDAWSNHFKFETWLEAFRALNIDPNLYLNALAPDTLLPWDFIDVGISKDELIAEFNKTIAIK